MQYAHVAALRRRRRVGRKLRRSEDGEAPMDSEAVEWRSQLDRTGCLWLLPMVSVATLVSECKPGWYQVSGTVVMYLEDGSSTKTCPSDSTAAALCPYRTALVRTGAGLEKLCCTRSAIVVPWQDPHRSSIVPVQHQCSGYIVVVRPKDQCRSRIVPVKEHQCETSAVPVGYRRCIGKVLVQYQCDRSAVLL